MEHQSSSQLLAYSSPCRRLGLSSSSSGEMSSSEGNDVPFSCHQQIFREADGVAPMERPIEDASCASAPFGVDASSSEHQSSESFEPSPFLTITRANPISSCDSISNNDDRYGTITRGHSCCEDDDDMNYQAHQDVAIEQDDVLRSYNTSTPSAMATGAAIDFSPFFRADPAPITPDASASTVVLNTDQSLLTTDQIQPNLFHSSSANNYDNTTLLLSQDQNGQRSFSPSGVTEIQNQQRGGGRGDGDAAHHRYHQGHTSKVAPMTPTISNVNSHVEDDTEQQQQRSPFRARLYHDDRTQDQEGNNANGSNLQYLHHPLIHASWTSTTDGSTVQLSASASASSSLLCSSTSAESCSFDASAAAGGANNM